MMHYSVQPRDRIFVKNYGFLSFTKKSVSLRKEFIKNNKLILKT